ncbi:MAG TPA: FMN-binding protein [Candidatus Saccharimonadales bacterium]|jgi:uncharacterized protein with FMN-binding domain|nr:FMN-binding protein [Candidatus Saccharimonadales bacterium]
MRSKQLLLTAFVIVTFALYSLQQRHQGSGTVIAPAAKINNSQAASTNSGSSSSSGSGSSSGSSSTSSTSSATYKDGTYTGSASDAFYGNIQVQATISGGKITDVQFLQYPNEQNNSVRINQAAMPYLKQEAIQAQNANVDIITGATDTSQAFIQSLGSALQKAQVG